MLKGPGLWFFNDGGFQESDARALRSFGINTKAADATVIGKFGLGMKSVFHLCEALFYVAWDGAKGHRDGLTPWKQEGTNPHPDWEEIQDLDWKNLEDLARPLALELAAPWFLLWIPLRRREHLRRPDGQETGAIIRRFPGDEPQELAFLDDPELAFDLAQILPLLRHLERIEHRSEVKSFVLELQSGPRLLTTSDAAGHAGEILADGERVLQYAGLCQADDGHPGSPFADLKALEQWPRSWYRDENGHEHQAEDKTSPEGAVLFCGGNTPSSRSGLHWAVFLPLEQGGERLGAVGNDGAHCLILHGQFFIDAGRKKIHGLELLHETPPAIKPGRMDDAALRHTWNRHLTQGVLLPLVIPALEHYVAEAGLSEVDCAALTQALAATQWFARFRPFVCTTDAWVRMLLADAKPTWARITGGDRDRLRPFPTPPKSAPERPWQVFPRLRVLDILAFDGDAPSLTGQPCQWSEAELRSLLAEVSGPFSDGPRMDYLGAFLDCPRGARPYLATEALQAQLIRLFREGLRVAGPENRRQLAEKSRRLIGIVEAQRRLALAVELPEALLRGLWQIDAPILLIPKGLDAEPAGAAVPDEKALGAWLEALDQALTAADSGGQIAILEAIQGLLRTLDPERRGAFLRVHRELRILAVRDPRADRQQALSFTQIRELREPGTLFGFAQGLGEARLGHTPRLAQVLPEARIALVQASLYRELFGDSRDLPAADSGLGCLIAVGKDTSGRLGGIAQRRALLEKANDPGTDTEARRGLRYLLHGSAAHRTDEAATLWITAHGQHAAWSKLWGQLHGDEAWSLVPDELADTLPRGRWDAAGVREIDADNLIEELRRTGPRVPAPRRFTRQEREEILSRIDDEELWRSLPLHSRLDGESDIASRNLTYLAPDSSASADPLLAAATLIAPAEHPGVQAQQRKWLKPLDDRARIELALAAPNPAAHWRTILDALERLPQTLGPDVEQRLRGTAWLPTRDGPAVKPEDVIDLAGGLGDETRRLVGEHRAAQGLCYATAADLSLEVVQHPAWPAQGQPLCASGRQGVEQLGLLLADLPEYAIGPWVQLPDTPTIELLARCDDLPGWRLLAQVLMESRRNTSSVDSEDAWTALREGLAKDPGPERLRIVLDWLSQEATNWKTRKAAFERYLGWFKAHAAHSREALRSLRLASVSVFVATRHQALCRSAWDRRQVCVGFWAGRDPARHRPASRHGSG